MDLAQQHTQTPLKNLKLFTSEVEEVKNYFASVVVQKTSAEIIVNLLDPNFAEDVFPNVRRLVSKNDLAASWTVQDCDSHSIGAILELKLSSETRIYWRLYYNSHEIDGRIQLFDLPEQRGTVINFIAHDIFPTESVEKILSDLFMSPQVTSFYEALKKFKALLETGSIPSTMGQSHGDRGMYV